MTAPGTPARHYSSHASLLSSFRRGKVPLDGIVVPATRNVDCLDEAVRLSATLAVPVVFLCSGLARPTEVIERARKLRGAWCTAVDMTALKSYGNLPNFATSQFADAIGGSYGDLSLKRNLGLLIGRTAGWRTLLFLDDDISGLSAPSVRRAVGTLQYHTAVGMPATRFPDNSVVCHARRLVLGDQQDVFVSGSALAVNLPAANSFFPEIYNEDWLFLAPHVDLRRVSKNGTVNQQTYYPFDTPERAARQEFGDVLAEGLLGYLHHNKLDSPPDAHYWNAFLRRRRDLISIAHETCRRRGRIGLLARDAREALHKAREVSKGIDPKVLVEYVEAWKADLISWRRHLSGIPTLGDLDKALAELGLQGPNVPPQATGEASSVELEGGDADAVLGDSRGRPRTSRRHGSAVDQIRLDTLDPSALDQQ
jgi:hypothetical protein